MTTLWEQVVVALPVTGLTVSGLVMLIILGFYSERVFTRTSVVNERQRHAEAIAAVRQEKASEIAAIRAEYAKRIDQMREDHAAQLQGLRDDRDTRIGEYQDEVAHWREAFQNSEMALVAERSQKGELLEIARNSEHLLRSLPSAPEESGDD